MPLTGGRALLRRSIALPQRRSLGEDDRVPGVVQKRVIWWQNKA